MTEVLAIIGGGTTLGALGLVAYLVVKLVGAKDETSACRDMLDGMREDVARLRGELDVEEAAHAVTRDLLAKEQTLRASVEAERNEAWRIARDHVAEEIATSDLPDAVAIGNRILSAPMPGVPLSETPDGALEKP